MKVRKQILDEDWWEDLGLMDKLFEPIVKLLRLVDSDLPTMGKVRQNRTLMSRSEALKGFAQPVFYLYGDAMLSALMFLPPCSNCNCICYRSTTTAP